MIAIQSYRVQKPTAISALKDNVAVSKLDGAKRSNVLLGNAGSKNTESFLERTLKKLGINNSDVKTLESSIESVKPVATIIKELIDKNPSNSKKAIALAHGLRELALLEVAGRPDAPDMIGGLPVIGSTALENGEAAFKLANGEIVSQTDVFRSFNAKLIVDSFSVLSSEVSDKEKALVLAGLGIEGARANELISDAGTGKLGSVLGLFQIANGWNDMSNEQRAASALQGSAMLTELLDDVGVAALGSLTTTRAFASGLGSVAGLVTGVGSAFSFYDNLHDIPKNDAKKYGAATMASIGASVAGPWGALVGGVIGFVSGFFGSSKSKERIERDAYREVFAKVGLSTKNENGLQVLTLADGSEYDINQESWSEKSFDRIDLLPEALQRKRALVNDKLISYEVDYTNDLDYMTSLPASGLAGFLLGGLDGRKGDMAAHITNAATSNIASREFTFDNWVKSMDNMRSLYAQAGIENFEQALQYTQSLYDEEKIGDHQAEQFIQGLQMIFSDYETSYEFASQLNSTRWFDEHGRDPRRIEATRRR